MFGPGLVIKGASCTKDTSELKLLQSISVIFINNFIICFFCDLFLIIQRVL